MSYLEKYLKYKNKYLELKYNLQQQGGAKINDHVYELNTQKYLGKITGFTAGLYQCITSEGKKFILFPSEENRSWYVPKLSELVDNMFKGHEDTFTESDHDRNTPREVKIPFLIIEPKAVPPYPIQSRNFAPTITPPTDQAWRDNTFDDDKQKEMDAFRAETLRRNQQIRESEGYMINHTTPPMLRMDVRSAIEKATRHKPAPEPAAVPPRISIQPPSSAPSLLPNRFNIDRSKNEYPLIDNSIQNINSYSYPEYINDYNKSYKTLFNDKKK